MSNVPRIAFALSWLVVGTALAQSPQKTTVTFGDWTTVCVFPEGKATCEMVQLQSLHNQTGPVSQITISRPSKTGSFKVTLQTPPNVWLEAGAKVVFDEKTSVTGAFRWCASTRCLADGDLDQNIVLKLKTLTDSGKLEFKEANQNDVSIPVSFNGFAAAMDAMGK